MLKNKLNRQFQKYSPSLKVSGFLLLWNVLFHAFTLSILLYWSLTSLRVLPANRMSILNQFLSENQILFAALSAFSALFFFRDTVADFWMSLREFVLDSSISAVKGFAFGLVILIALTLHHDLQFLGLSTQISLNFLASYAWILRALLIMLFVSSTEILVRRVIKEPLVQYFTLIFLYWIWFNPTSSELFTLALLFSLFTRKTRFSDSASSVGFLSAFFILIHALSGFNFFENEFTGLVQFKWVSSTDESLLQNSTLQFALFVLSAFTNYGRFRHKQFKVSRKELITP